MKAGSDYVNEGEINVEQGEYKEKEIWSRNIALMIVYSFHGKENDLKEDNLSNNYFRLR